MTKKHVHKYHKTDIGRNKPYVVFACANCTHYIPEAQIVGKRSICWRCGDEFTIGPHMKRLVKPHCDDCTRAVGHLKKQVEERHVDDAALTALLKELEGGDI